MENEKEEEEEKKFDGKRRKKKKGRRRRRRLAVKWRIASDTDPLSALPGEEYAGSPLPFNLPYSP